MRTRGLTPGDKATGTLMDKLMDQPIDERRATFLEYVAVVLTIAVIVVLAVWFLGSEILTGATPLG